MIQYNGITLLRDEDGTPMQVNIDLREIPSSRRC